ncbi:primosomal protein N' [Hartmannibacter diazotrophicus]|uniref:primosomal protein N' n=1 Tax=Hartmannibacter diazotrophicus TaxID=1482074 RepID=UPI001FE3EA88|nr:primosomal protein N' [Hartmannibacter diazotrophicus]
MADLFGQTDSNNPSATPTIAEILTPVALDQTYSYLVPEGMTVRPGSIVIVPLGPRKVIGAVWSVGGTSSVPAKKLRPIELVFSIAPLSDTLRELLDWVARYTLTPRGMMLRMVLRSPEALEPEAPVTGVIRDGDAPERMTDARRRVLATMEDGMAWTRTGLAASAGVSPGVVDGLVAAGTLKLVDLPPGRPLHRPDPDFNPRELTDAQGEAARQLKAAVANGFSVTLLEGVTGAGKTDVYMEAVAETLRKGRQALVLVPEIALTRDFLERFSGRFGANPGEWHSDVNPKQRARLWRGVTTGDVRVVVGARSALFLPFADLGLIVVDEEHDTAYKQEERATYNARDMAVVRGHMEKIPVVLASATPSLETRANVDRGRYTRIHLPFRATGASLPELALIDMRRAGPDKGRFLAPGLMRAVEATVGKGEQALLFLNRRGYAPLTLCRSCGHRFQCRNCSTWLVDHRFRGTLSCHHCGFTMPRPESCPECGTVDSLVACGPGVERIADEVQTLLPGKRTVVLSSDMTGGVQQLRRELAAIAEGDADIIIGTQLVAKGHTFPKLTLVGVVDADLGLAHGDPRAAERTFQLLVQVTGRAGRIGGEGLSPGLGILQTYAPEHPVMAALVSRDPERFYETELAERRAARMPPFGRLAGIIVSATDRHAAEDHARALARAAPRDPVIEVLGPADAPLALVRGRHRLRLLVHGDRDSDLSSYCRAWLDAAPKATGSVQVLVDIDPQSFM